MSEIIKISSGAPWENIVGYSRAVRINNTIEISGTTAPGVNEYEQTLAILKLFEKILNDLGANLSNIIRTRIYCIDISKWEEIGKAHGEIFSEIRPTTSMVEISKLINPEILVEIEATAYIPSTI